MMKKSLFALVLVCFGTIFGVSAAKKQVRVFTIGDSTMADKTELESSPERGWGQLFPTYLKDGVIVENHAKNGRSTKSFLDEGRWAVVMERLQKGDVVIIQFGHNDQKVADSTRYTTIEQYQENLIKMIQGAQSKRAHVILCTSICRRYFKDGVFYKRHGGYTEAARRVAKLMNVPMLDMEQLTADWLVGLGDEASKAYYMNVAPGECTKYPEGKQDDTHLKEAGALVVGRMVAEEIVRQNIKCLKDVIVLEDEPEVKYTTPCGIK